MSFADVEEEIVVDENTSYYQYYKSINDDQSNKLNSGSSIGCAENEIALSYFHETYIPLEGAADESENQYLQNDDTNENIQSNYDYNSSYIKAVLDGFVSKQEDCIKEVSFKKWQESVCLQQKGIKYIYFNKWKSMTRKHNTNKKKCLSHIQTKFFVRWKLEYKKTNKIKIADIHFKITLLSDHFNYWRIYTVERRVLKRMNDVARICFEDKVCSHTFNLWKQKLIDQQVLNHQQELFLLKSVFISWRNSANIKRIKHQQENFAAKVVNDSTILKISFKKWKQTLQIKQAEKMYNKRLERRTFQLWNLKMWKKCLQRRLARAHYRKTLQRHFYCFWKFQLLQKQHAVSYRLKIKQERKYFDKWKSYCEMKMSSRLNYKKILSVQQFNCRAYYFQQWKHEVAIKRFKNKHLLWKKEYVIRQCILKWKDKVKKSKLSNSVEQFKPKQELLILKVCFRTWVSQKLKKDERKYQMELLLKSLALQQLSKYFQSWRMLTQYEILINPTQQKFKRKVMSRHFDTWLLRYKLQVQCKHSIQQKDLQMLKSIFTKWRLKMVALLKDRKLKSNHKVFLLQKCIKTWKEYCNHQKIKRKEIITYYAHHWLDLTQQRILDKEIEKAKQASDKVCMKVYFIKWLHRLQDVRASTLKLEALAAQHYDKNLMILCFDWWVRQNNNKHVTTKHLLLKHLHLISKVFSAWKVYTKNEADAQLIKFQHKLDQHLLNTSSSTLNDTFQSSKADTLKNSNTENDLHLSLNFSTGDSFQSSTFPSYRKSDSLTSTDKSGKLQLNNLIFPSDNDDDDNKSYEIFSQSNEEGFDLSTEDNQDVTSLDHSLNEEQKVLSWTDHWKYRYKTSKKILKERRTLIIKSQSIQPYPFDSSTPRTWPADGYRWINFNQQSIVTKGPPHPPNILNRSFLFAPQVSDDENVLLTSSGVHSICSLDQDCHSTSLTYESDIINRNKELLLIGTLKHWKLNNFSKVFYAWLKYTQAKRHRIELYEYFTERRAMYEKHEKFLAWNRELYCRKVAVEHFNTVQLRSGLKKLKRYCVQRQAENRRLIKAECYNRKKLLNLVLITWKKKLQCKYNVNNKIIIWKNSVKSPTKNDQHSTLLQTFNTVQNKNVLVHYFNLWKNNQIKKETAAKFYHNTIMAKYLNFWWHWLLTIERKKAKVYQLQLMFNLKNHFMIWKRQLKCKKLMVSFQQDYNISLHHKIVKEWHLWSQDRLKLQRHLVGFRKESQLSLIRKSFAVWKIELGKIDIAEKFYCNSLKKRIFSTWLSFYQLKHQHNQTVIEQEKKINFNLVEKVFSIWKKAYDNKQKMLATTQGDRKKQVICIQRKVIVQWLAFTQKCRKDKNACDVVLECKSSMVVTLMFDRWKTTYQNNKLAAEYSRINSLAKSFKGFTINREKQKIFIQYNDLIKQKRDNQIVLNYFSMWKNQRDFKINNKKEKEILKDAAVHHYEVKLSKEYYKFWKESLYAVQHERKRAKYLMMKYSKIWREKTNNFKVVKEFFDRQVCEKYWMVWRKLYIKRKVVKKMKTNDERKLLSKIFSRWLTHTEIKQTLTHDFRLYQKQIWFRKWMNAYNET